MEKELNAVLLSQIGNQYLTTAQLINDFAVQHRKLNPLNEGAYQQLRSDAKDLLEIAAEMKVMSTLLVKEETAGALEELKNIGKEMENSISRFQNIQQLILTITGLVSLGHAIIQKNPAQIGTKINEFLAIWKKSD
ncbi:MAG: hypothetical protein WD398_07990 [Cyclobacteriaceae bacterium]